MNKPLTGEEWLNSPSKRRIDIALSLALLGPATGVSALSAAALYLEVPINPVFRQVRMGKDGAHFDILKLRTMTRTDFYDPSDGTMDDRRTPVGKLLGIAGVDELPQLYNVLNNDMSFVGPRPLPLTYFPGMRDVLGESGYNEWFRAYTLPKPGLTSEFSNLSRGLVPQSDEYLRLRAEKDIAYIDNTSRLFDMSIILESGLLAVNRLVTLQSQYGLA